jgi:acyl-CoA hydrolase
MCSAHSAPEVNGNQTVEMHPCDRTNDTALIAKNDRVVAINSAIEIDQSGQMDFIRGASRSTGGKPILALPSTAAGGKVSRIALQLNAGAGVVTTRGHVRWIVTEYGAVNLHGKTLRERGEALIAIAHPDFRAQLRRELLAVRHFDFMA